MRIGNTPMPFDWGIVDGLSERLDLPRTGKPQAELWLGAHPLHPAQFLDDDRSYSDLAAWGTLPFMFKVLAVNRVLSLQVHPNTDQARAGYAREQANGVALDAPERSFRDQHAKPEMVVAIDGPFSALCGFRDLEDTAQLLRWLARFRPALKQIADFVRTHTVREVLSDISRISGEIEPALDEAKGQQAPPHLFAHVEENIAALQTIAEQYPGDPGIGSATLLNYVRLQPGDALWLPTGTPHAYLSGYAVEIMGPSDNVLRGGLTNKHVDCQAFLDALEAEPRAPQVFLEKESVATTTFHPEFRACEKPEFSLTRITGSADVAVSTYACLLVLDGKFHVDGREICRGQSVLLEPGNTRVTGTGQAFLAQGV
jgi:mannose-6-phosphate isomerase